MKMSSGETKKVSRQDIQLVQNLIERCLQLYMNQEEVVRTLLHQAKIEPGFTELVWQKLEEENLEFFRAYHLRLMVKDQIERFNDLLERQVETMQMYPTGLTPMPNGSQIRQIPPNSTCQATDHAEPNVKPENVHQPVNINLSHVYTDSASSLQPCMQTAYDVSSHARRNHAPSILAQNSNIGLLPRAGGRMIKSEVEYSGHLPFLYGTNTNILEAHPGIAEPSVSSFSSVESNSKPLDADTPSFGFLGQIPRNFSLSDLTADFSNSSDILESYSGSPFLARDIDNFLDPQDIQRLDSISEGLSFEDFASD